MFSHVTFGSTDIDRSCRFYDALFVPLNITRQQKTREYASWAIYPDSPQFFVCLPFNNAEASAGNGNMVAFHADSTASVDNAYQAGLNNGGAADGPPGPRPQYGNGYYGAYVRDPDDNKVHLVYRPPT